MSEEIFDFAGQVAFVTGAGQGAGREIARLLARYGARVAVNDYHLDRAEAVASELRAEDFQAIAVQADVGDLASVRGAIASTKGEFGDTTLLVNNAGMAGPEERMGPAPLFWEETPDAWGKYLDTNLFGVLNCCHAAVPGMVAGGYGRIVTIVSDAGRVGEPRHAVYSAAKAGAAGFVRSLSKEVGRFGITCNAISLSALRPPISDEEMAAVMEKDAMKSQMSRYIIRRFGESTEVAALAAFLCSGVAGWITGQTYPLNGGYSLAV